MHEVIRKIHIPKASQTGILEEREFFAKLEAEDRLRRNRDRRDRLIAALGFRRRAVRDKRR